MPFKDHKNIIYVQNEEQLEQMAAVLSLSEPKLVGVDIEYSKSGAYYGLVCLIQISWSLFYPRRDREWDHQTFIIDTIALSKEQISKTMGKLLFENPNIIKVMHGCSNTDVWWLAKDFGIRV